VPVPSVHEPTKPSRIMQANEMLLFPMFNFGKPRTAGQWLAHVVLGIVALFLVWWLLRLYVL
jgi:hypothetical protein